MQSVASPRIFWVFFKYFKECLSRHKEKVNLGNVSDEEKYAETLSLLEINRLKLETNRLADYFTCWGALLLL